MRAADTLIPARFLTLLGHLCVVITLLWENHQTTEICLPSPYHHVYFETYRGLMITGYSTSIAFIVLEFITFMHGLTMFSYSVSLLSIGCHGLASIILTYFVLDGWFCDWFWIIFIFCSVPPAVTDTTVAVLALFYRMTVKGKWFPNAISPEHEQLADPNGHKGGWSMYLILAGVATTLGLSLPVGYNIGVVNTPAERIKNFCNESVISRFNVTLEESAMNILWSSIVSIFIVGGCTGSILGAYLANSLGRKKATIATSVLSLIGAIMFLFCRSANSIEMLILGRLVVGLSSGLTTSIVPMYLTELSPLSLTGAVGVLCPMGVNVGVFVGQVMGLKFLLGGVDNWPYLLSVYALLVIVCLPVLFLLPESPKYLFLVKKDEDKTLRELTRLRGVSSSILSEDVHLLQEEARTSDAAMLTGERVWTMCRVMSDTRLRLPLLLTCAMQAGQQTSGINAVFYYSQTIFKQGGLSDESSQYATIGCGFINVCTALLMLYLLPRFGRRPLLLGSVLSASVLLACLAAALKFMHILSWMPYVCMILVLSYVLVYGFGLGPIPYFIASEMFEVGPRPAGMAWGSLANWTGNFIIGMSFPSMREVIGPYSFIIFSLITAGLFVLQKMYFPETQGRTPTQVAQLCSRGLRSRPLLTPDTDSV